MDKTNFCLLKCLLWKKVFCSSPSSVNQLGARDFVKVDNLEVPCFVTDWTIKILLYTEAGTRTNKTIG